MKRDRVFDSEWVAKLHRAAKIIETQEDCIQPAMDLVGRDVATAMLLMYLRHYMVSSVTQITDPAIDTMVNSILKIDKII